MFFGTYPLKYDSDNDDGEDEATENNETEMLVEKLHPIHKTEFFK